MNKRNLLSKRQLAEMAGCTFKQIDRALAEGQIMRATTPKHKTVDRSRSFFSQDQVEKLKQFTEHRKSLLSKSQLAKITGYAIQQIAWIAKKGLIVPCETQRCKDGRTMKTFYSHDQIEQFKELQAEEARKKKEGLVSKAQLLKITSYGMRQINEILKKGLIVPCETRQSKNGAVRSFLSQDQVEKLKKLQAEEGRKNEGLVCKRQLPEVTGYPMSRIKQTLRSELIIPCKTQRNKNGEIIRSFYSQDQVEILKELLAEEARQWTCSRPRKSLKN